ncbi:MAG TPA: TetR/AcrR family transcriptional regulator [Myxococcota bacterium]|nr:TetR/AcrR family transcriptional regulator [Myxococcota bacterium]
MTIPRAPQIESTPDGREQRSERSRGAIIQALFHLVGSAVLQPPAQQVAASARVGIRTVFRHFSDTESLCAAMAARVQAEAMPLLQTHEPHGSRSQRARTLLEQRVDFFERIAPYKRSGNLQRVRSPFIGGQHRTLVRTLRADLLRWLPELRRVPASFVEVLDVALSFEAWERLRTDQCLSRERGLEAVECTVRTLLGVPDPRKGEVSS